MPLTIQRILQIFDLLARMAFLVHEMKGSNVTKFRIYSKPAKYPD